MIFTHLFLFNNYILVLHFNFDDLYPILTTSLSLSFLQFVGEKSTKAYQKLTLVTSPANNHGNYRKLLASVHKRESCVPYGCIPYFGEWAGVHFTHIILTCAHSCHDSAKVLIHIMWQSPAYLYRCVYTRFDFLQRW